MSDEGTMVGNGNIIVVGEELKHKLKLLGQTAGLGFCLLTDSFSKSLLNIYYVPGIPFLTVGTPGLTQ